MKVGLHTGRCISVTLNDELDYYGSAANMAARLQGQSIGGDIVMSMEFASDPAVRQLVQDYDLIRDEVELKGFEQSVPFFRVASSTLMERRKSSPGPG